MYGLGAAPCNWTDEFGECVYPLDGTISQFDLAADAREVLGGRKTFTQFVNENAKTLGILAAVVFGVVFIAKR